MRKFIDVIEGIADLATAGEVNDDNDASMFRKSDVDIISSPKGSKKIINAFSRTKHCFNLYVIFPTARKSITSSIVMFDHRRIDKAQIEAVLGKKINTDGNITVVYFNNTTSRDQMPMNAWTMAHRLGHAIQAFMAKHPEMSKEINQIHEQLAVMYRAVTRNNNFLYKGAGSLPLYYPVYQHDDKFLDTITDIMTMKSARDRKVGTVLEVFCEMLAQYLIVGKVILKPLQGTEQVITKAQSEINKSFDQLLDKLVGQIISF